MYSRAGCELVHFWEMITIFAGRTLADDVRGELGTSLSVLGNTSDGGN